MASLKALKEQSDHIFSEPVEDTDLSSFVPEMQSNHPVQVTESQDPETLQVNSLQPGYKTTSSDRIRQPVDNGSKYICAGTISSDFFKELQYSDNSCEKCCCLAPPPKISDLMNDEDLLYTLRLKLDPSHCTIKNWKNFASRWGMTYDELVLLEHRNQGASCSPTQEFLLRYNQKSVTELTELCRIYQRIDVLRVLQRWVEKDWPSRWQKAH